MDSPERNLTVAATASQGSPIFNYLCTLSPIKPVKTGVVQTFTELSFPPPPTVFISPRVETKRDNVMLNRKNSTVMLDATQAIMQKREGNIWFDSQKRFLSHLSDVENRNPSWNESSSHYPGHFESIHSEESGPTSTCATVSKQGNRKFEKILSKSETGVPHKLTSILSPSTNLVSSSLCDNNPSSKDWRGHCDSLGNVVNKENPLRGIATSQIHPSLQGGGWLASGSKEGPNMATNQGTDGFMLSKDKGKPVNCTLKNTTGDRGNHESLWELHPGYAASLSTELEKKLPNVYKLDHQVLQKDRPAEHRLGFSARTLIEEGASTATLDSVSLQSSLSQLPDCKSNFASDLKTNAERQTEGGQQSWRANLSGVPRRCLDFETSEAWERKKSDLPKSKLSGMLLDSSAQCGSCNDSDGNRASVLLDEKKAVTCDETNRRLSQCLKQDIHINAKNSTSHYSRDLLPPIHTECESFQCSTQISSPSHSSGIPSIPVGAPSGIGLHLNSLGGSMPGSNLYKESHLNSNALASCSKLADSTRREPLRDISTGRYENRLLNGANIQNGSIDGDSFGPGLVVSIVENTRMHQYEVQTTGSAQVEVAKSTTCFQSVSLGIKQLEGNAAFGEVENKFSSLRGKRVFLQDIPQQAESDQVDDSSYSPKSPRRKRMSISAGDKSGDGCKHCNCKKSKCLKLYCECFSAGVFCADPCSCHNCFNKPDFEETVLGTRQQIESRNPLAFAPKIVLAPDLSPANGEECIETPASARHKKGCHCKKSQCLKKYCECYQAGVGCADGCKCEGCKNIFGRKEGSEDPEDKEHDIAALEKECIRDRMNTTDLISRSENQDEIQNSILSPITPSFNHSGGSMLELRSSSGIGHCPSEELSSPFISIPASVSCRSDSKLFRSLKGAETSSSQFLKNGSSPPCLSNFTTTGRLSPSWDRLGDICTLTPLPHPPLRPLPASTSFLDRMKSCTSFWQNNDTSTSCSNANLVGYEMSPLPSIQPPVHHSYPLFTSNVYQFQAPDNGLTMMTPMPSASLITRGATPSDFEGQSGVDSHQSVWLNEDSDTPDFAKDFNASCASGIILKTRSPQQKRVSPRQQSTADTNLRDIMSPGLKFGRKFILQAMPSFPSATRAIPSVNAEAGEYLNQP